MSSKVFQFKKFKIAQDKCSMKIGTDGVLLGAWAETNKAKKILDIGTGTGVIAIMLAQRTVDAEVHGVEIDETSAKQAMDNTTSSAWNERLHIHCQSIQDFAKLSRDSFDLIVSNPPFFTGGTLSNKENRNQARHTVKLPNGDLLTAARKLLTKEGKFCVVLPKLEGLRFKEMAQTYGLYTTLITEVKTTPTKEVERLLIQFEKQASEEIATSELIIQKGTERNVWTDDYIALTKAFYLKI